MINMSESRMKISVTVCGISKLPKIHSCKGNGSESVNSAWQVG